MLIDTHTHLYAEEFDADREQSIEEALKIGVNRFYLPAIDSESYDNMISLEQQFPNHTFPMIGLHPCYVKPETYEAELAFVEQKLQERRFCAIGEIGIDLYWDKTTFDIQKTAFQAQIQLALSYNLPIVIHARESLDEIFDIVQPFASASLRGIFHCFSGSKEQAEKAIELGFLVGIGGVVTFKNGKIDTFLSEIPLEHIVLETDSPYLAPVPYRGKRNESKYLKEIVEKLCDIYGTSYEEIAKITTENALKVFNN